MTRRWPLLARMIGAALLVGLALVLQAGVWTGLRDYPFLLFFPAVVLCTVVFGSRAGLLAVGLSALSVGTFLFPPIGSPLVDSPQQALALVLFLLLGAFAAGVVGLLNGALTDLAQAKAELERAAQQKDLLLREAAHRFRNDLATLAAVLRLQERTLSDPQAQAALRATADRIGVMARVQDRLQRDDGAGSVVYADEFIAGLCNDLRAALIDLRPIRLEVRAERHALPQEEAVAVGLIINELVTNALKYAFPEDRSGLVWVIFERDEAGFRLQVRDDGVGIEPHRPAQGTGLGQRLVRSLATQVGGSFTIEPDAGDPGTIATLRFGD